MVCGTGGFGNPTTGITFGLILELTRRIGWEHARMKSGVPWQNTLGMDIEGKTLGVLGLGKLGARAAGVGKAFGMKVIAWSQNLTPERCKEVGVEYVSQGRSVPQRRRRDDPSVSSATAPAASSPPRSSA